MNRKSRGGDHRPWPVPDSLHSWRQSWHDLAFLHWPIDRTVVRHLVPSSLEIEEFDGTTWIGVVPFRMSDVTLRGLPAIPGLSAFPELNVRLYVTDGEKPGVWFLSLDATKRLAVWAARKFFFLPYYRSSMSLDRNGTEVRYSSKRVEGNGGESFQGTYSPIGDIYESKQGTLEHWLTERYSLYATRSDGSLYRTEIDHEQWPLQKCRARIEENSMLCPFDIDLDPEPAIVHFASRIDVKVWSPELMEGGDGLQ